jgi:mono/diheme cytochrome c family protein
MCRARTRWVPVATLSALLMPGALAQSLDPAAQRALVDQYCVGCHNQKLKTGELSLEGSDFSKVGEQAGVWERVLRKMRTGQMPPPGLPRPDAAKALAFAKSLEQALDRAAAAHPNPGRTLPHRLNRAEYSNAIRDLLALDIKAGSALPADDSGHGFDNIANLLSISPALLERYMSAARSVSRLAVGDLNMLPGEEQFSVGRGARNERLGDDLPFDSRGGFSFQYYFPVDAEYVLRIGIAGNADAPSTSPYELRLPVKAGQHTVAATFLRESARNEAAAPAAGRRGGPVFGVPMPAGASAEMDLRLDDARLKRFQVPQRGTTPEIASVSVLGPYKITGRGDTPSRARIFVCRPASASEEESCAQTIFSTLARRAFHRPVSAEDIRPLLAFYRSGREEGDFDHGIELALGAMLVSPDFLFRVELDPRGAAPGQIYRISDHELASRLSFFLWSSIPDDELLKLADQGKLRDQAMLEAQVRRLLDDPRSDALVNNFGAQWLYLRNLASAKPDADAFPEWDESLRHAFRQETELFLRSIFREDRSVFDLLEANYTFLNQRLAEHYGIKGVYGPHLRRVNMTDPNRAGLLGHGSILTVTSNPNRTSVVLRGKWILENLLGAPPPPPPADVPELKPHAKDGRRLTMREQMEEHRINPVCSSCHARMDPIGFALENYDGVGKWRTQEGLTPIDASGKLPGGVEFNGPAGLKKLLLSDYREDFVTNVTEKLLTYGLGRGLEYYDQPAVRAIAREAAREDYRMSALVTAIVKSVPFQMRRTAEQ